MLELKITEEAKSDLKAVGRYTQKTWGEEQRRKFMEALYLRFDWLTEYPDFGNNRDEIEAGYYSYKEGKHVIFYIYDAENLAVIGVLHERMDFKRYL